MCILKKTLYAVGGAALLVAGSLLGISFESDTEITPPQTAAVLGAETDTVVPPRHSNILENVGMLSRRATPSFISPSEEGERVKVIRAVDGDTIEVEIDGKVERVRYIGIDTPETADPRKPVQCFGVEASKKNKELVEGKMVRLERDITDRDKYNRLLRYIWLGDTLINETLVAQGFATSYSYPPDIKYRDQFVAAEKKAREDKLGLWSACGAAAVSSTFSSPPQPPFPQSSYIPMNVGMTGNEKSAVVQTAAANPSCTIKGNINASGEKIYHLQGCGSYAKTTIDESRGERWFCSEQEAQSAGWRKALNCS